MEKKPIPKEYFNKYEEITNQLTKEDYKKLKEILTKTQYKAVRYRFINKLTYPECAKVLKVSKQAVEQNINLAIKKIKVYLYEKDL